MTAPDIHSLVGAYALDAVDDLERAAFDRHLRDCEDCRTEVAEFQETTARLAGDAWSVPPPGLRDNVLAEIATTRQLAPVTPSRRRHRWGLRLTAAAAAVVAATAAGTTVFVVQEQRVRHAQSISAAPSREQVILSAPDLVVRQETLTTGGQVTVASSHAQNAGVILVAPSAAPAAGKVFEAWTIGAQGVPVPAGTGLTSVTHVVENLSATSAVAVTVEPAPGSTKPTMPIIGAVKLT